MNNRKLIQGFYNGLGLADTDEVMRLVDKLDKLPEDAVAKLLVEEAGATEEQAEKCLALARISTTDTGFVEQVRALGVSDPLLDTGLDELATLVDACAGLASDRVEIVADLKIARGLDYYTGTVFETRLVGHEGLGSICSGGRYDALASDGRTTYPGVGISLGAEPGPGAAAEQGRAHGQPVGAERRARGRQRRGVAPRERRDRRPGARERCAVRGRGDSGEVRQANPLCRASRHPLRSFRNSGRTPDQGHPQRRPAAGRPGHLDTADRRPDPDGLDKLDHRRVHRKERSVIRTHDAGTLRAENVDQHVTLAGWVARRRDHGGVAFIDLRDASGVVQVVIRDEAVAHNLRNEFCLKIDGVVSVRPDGNQNPNLPTGEIEVIADADGGVEVLSASEALPFPIDDAASHQGGDVGEEARLKYRYLDLRRSGPNAAIRLRSKINKAARDVLDSHDFVEIETPTLTRSTPEGARDFLVPARLAPGSWYALPQSPQLFKQLLMVAGMERYYQIARCYRDEDFRADRQPEFTQLDIEMSFVDQDDVIALMEDVLARMWALIGYEIPLPIPRMTYADAMSKYGSDKPDLRMGNELVECTEFFAETPFRVFQADYVGAVVMPGGASQPRKKLDAWQDWAKQRGAKGLAYLLIKEDGEITGPVAKNISDAEREGIAAHVGAKPGDCIFFAAGAAKPSRALLGAARLEIGRRCDLIDEDAWAFTWVVDAPLFEPSSDAVASGDVAVGAGAWTAVHHAFTSPKPEFLDTFDTDPGPALAYAYDIVCNGNELGGGSIRIHREDLQKRVFKVMGLSQEEAEEKFGFLLDALKYGAPPHGGIAVGMDRIAALLSGADSIREVIAFPKSGGGYDPLTAAPAPITPEQRKEAGIDGPPVKEVAPSD